MRVYLLKLRDFYSRMAKEKKSVWVLTAAIICGCFIPLLPIRIAGEVLFLLWVIGWALNQAGTVSDQEQRDRSRLLRQLITANLMARVENPGWIFADGPDDTNLAALEDGEQVRLALDDIEYDLADVQMMSDYSLHIKLHNTTKEWYDASGHDAIEELVYDAASQGKQELLLTPELLCDLPKPERWTQLANFLNNDGIIAFIQDDGLRLLTEGGD